ncbi:hypothetical protein Landi51_02366 [Colletotrichum acutatum]
MDQTPRRSQRFLNLVRTLSLLVVQLAQLASLICFEIGAPCTKSSGLNKETWVPSTGISLIPGPIPVGTASNPLANRKAAFCYCKMPWQLRRPGFPLSTSRAKEERQVFGMDRSLGRIQPAGERPRLQLDGATLGQLVRAHGEPRSSRPAIPLPAPILLFLLPSRNPAAASRPSSQPPHPRAATWDPIPSATASKCHPPSTKSAKTLGWPLLSVLLLPQPVMDPQTDVLGRSGNLTRQRSMGWRRRDDDDRQFDL